MSEFPTIENLDDTDPIINIIQNALKWDCFYDDTDNDLSCNTTEVIIYDNTILASPIPDVESLSECDHDFIGLGGRSMINGQDMGKKVFEEYWEFLNLKKDVGIESDKVTLDNALKDLRDTRSSLVAVDDIDSNRQLLSSLLGNQSLYPGTHFPPKHQVTTPNNKLPLDEITNSANKNVTFTVDESPSNYFHHGSTPTNTTSNATPLSAQTTASERERILDRLSDDNSQLLKSHLHTNEGVNKSTVNDSSSSEMCNEIFGKVSKQTELLTQQITSASIDHGCLNLNTSTDIFGEFNKIYDRGITTLEGVDRELLKLSYVYYSRNPRNNNIRGLLIVLGESHDESNGSKPKKKQKNDSTTTLVNVKMFKYLFSCDDIECNNLKYEDVSNIAPNVATLCSEMYNSQNNKDYTRKIDGVDVALMKAAADRTLKIGALLFAVGLENEKRCFVTHDVKNFQYNKVKKILQKDKTLKNVPLFSVLTTQHSRGKQGGEPRRYILVHQPQLQDPELQKLQKLQKLINDKFILTNSCEKLELEIQEMENEKNTFETELRKPSENRQSSRLLERETNRNMKVIDEKNEKIRTSREKLKTYRNNIERIKQQIKEQQNLTTLNMTPSKQISKKGGIEEKGGREIDGKEIGGREIGGREEKGGREIGGRRTKRSIKVITKRKIKVKSKTIKKKSRRRNKTRRQRKKL